MREMAAEELGLELATPGLARRELGQLAEFRLPDADKARYTIGGFEFGNYTQQDPSRARQRGSMPHKVLAGSTATSDGRPSKPGCRSPRPKRRTVTSA